MRIKKIFIFLFILIFILNVSVCYGISDAPDISAGAAILLEIGRASCRERV